MMQLKKEVEGTSSAWPQKSRAAGIHLVVGHAEADGGRDHRTHQVEFAGAHLLPGLQPVR